LPLFLGLPDVYLTPITSVTPFGFHRHLCVTKQDAASIANCLKMSSDFSVQYQHEPDKRTDGHNIGL